jgi:hypothetical protein
MFFARAAGQTVSSYLRAYLRGQAMITIIVASIRTLEDTYLRGHVP